MRARLHRVCIQQTGVHRLAVPPRLPGIRSVHACSTASLTSPFPPTSISQPNRGHNTIIDIQVLLVNTFVAGWFVDVTNDARFIHLFSLKRWWFFVIYFACTYMPAKPVRDELAIVAAIQPVSRAERMPLSRKKLVWPSVFSYLSCSTCILTTTVNCATRPTLSAGLVWSSFSVTELASSVTFGGDDDEAVGLTGVQTMAYCILGVVVVGIILWHLLYAYQQGFHMIEHAESIPGIELVCISMSLRVLTN